MYSSSFIVVLLPTLCFNPLPDVVENLLYLLWQHLQFYLLRSKPADPHLQFGKLTSTHTAMRRMQGTILYLLEDTVLKNKQLLWIDPLK